MTTLNKSALTALFEQGDVPSGTNYADLIDSQVNVAETSVQTMQGPLNATEIITPRVSATDINVTGTFTFSGPLSVATVSANSIKVLTDVSADGTIYASAMRSGGFIGTAGIVSAAGITQGTAATLSFVSNRLRGVADGVTTGCTPLANRAGLVQYILNEGVSANLWPPTGGTINGLAVNIPYPLPASAMTTVVSFTASAYGAR